MSDLTDLQANVALLIGQSIDDVGSQIDGMVQVTPYCWRWMTPTDVASPLDVRGDRINVQVDGNNAVIAVTLG